ncbi:MAG: beta-lactamase family protein [Hydrococcus sp. Prado102]|jgi:CubicO group peptidase (beta-lactamase class C family)|nr:beta-lactamase family protein [Hydrococcus sp. Prado102]
MNFTIINKNFKRLFIGLVLLFWMGLVFPCFAQEIPQQPHQNIGVNPLDSQELEIILDRFFGEQMEKLHIPGAAFSLVKDGEIVLSKGYGFAHLEKKIPVNPDLTIFRIGSISKLFTATAVMQLAQKKQLKLDEDINRYLQAFQIDKTYSKPITFSNLLTHTDGIDSGWAIGAFARTRSQMKPLEQYVTSKPLPPRILPPQEVFFYGDVGMVLAGYLVEKISEIPFEEYVRQNILEPLKMQHSGFEQPLPPQLQSDLAVGYKYNNGSYQQREFAFNQNVPAAAFMATAEDMAHFAIAHLQNGRYEGGQILSEATAKEMHRRQFAHHRLMPGSAYGFYEREFQSIRALEHSGRMNGYSSLLMLFPDLNLGFFVACNNNASELLTNLSQEIFKHYYPVSHQSTILHRPLANSQTPLQQLSGTYRYIHYPHSTIEKLGAILGEAPEVKLTSNRDRTLTLSSNSNKWVEVEPWLFYDEKTGNYMTFRRDERDRITHLFTGSSIFSALEKIKWYETAAFQFKLAGICVLIFVSACLAGLIRWVVNRFGQPPQLAKTVWLARFLAFLVSFLYLAFLSGMGWFVFKTDFWEFFYGLPVLVKFLLYLTPIASGLTVALIITTALAWRTKNWSVLSRLHHLLVALAALIFIPFLNYWNLLGLRW